jgi:hypothetical protein
MNKIKKPFNITSKLEARGLRINTNIIAAVLNEGAMTLPGKITLILIDSINSSNAALQSVPIDWSMSHSELATAGFI